MYVCVCVTFQGFILFLSFLIRFGVFCLFSWYFFFFREKLKSGMEESEGALEECYRGKNIIKICDMKSLTHFY